MLYQTRRTISLSRWILRVILPIRARQVTDIRELSPHLRADIGARDVHLPDFR